MNHLQRYHVDVEEATASSRAPASQPTNKDINSKITRYTTKDIRGERQTNNESTSEVEITEKSTKFK